MEIATHFDLENLLDAPRPNGAPEAAAEAAAARDRLIDRPEIVIASQSTGRHLLAQPEEYTEQLSRFDCQARLNMPYTHLAATPDMYLGFAASQVLEWTEQEQAALGQAIESVREKWLHLDLQLPARIYLVKTSGREEEGLSYTRSGGVVVLPAAVLDRLNEREASSSAAAGELSGLERLLLAACFYL